MRCPPAAWVLLALPTSAVAAPVKLPGHSISNPPDIHHLAKAWHLTGAESDSLFGKRLGGSKVFTAKTCKNQRLEKQNNLMPTTSNYLVAIILYVYLIVCLV